MKKTAEKVIFSTIYTILIALVVTYICHRELEPTSEESLRAREETHPCVMCEEISMKLQKLDVRNDDTRDLVTNLIIILKDCGKLTTNKGI